MRIKAQGLGQTLSNTISTFVIRYIFVQFRRAATSFIYSFILIRQFERDTSTSWHHLLRAHNSPLPSGEIDHTTGVYVPYSFRTTGWLLLRHFPTDKRGWRGLGQQLNVTAQRHDHLNWEKIWNHSASLPTELTGRRLNMQVTIFLLNYQTYYLE